MNIEKKIGFPDPHSVFSGGGGQKIFVNSSKFRIFFVCMEFWNSIVKILNRKEGAQ
jgi:hypothetical protein